MALNPEQQAQVDIQTALETSRHTNQMELQGKTTKLESVRLARDVLIENRRLDTSDSSSDISAADVVSFAQQVEAYVGA